MLDGPSFRRLFRGVYVWVGLDLTMGVWLSAALLKLPVDAAVSHVTALWLYGIEIGPAWPLQFSTNSTAITEDPHLILHRRHARLSSRLVDGVPVLRPERTFIDAATQLGTVRLVQIAEMLVHHGHTTLEALWDFALSRHFDGVVRARRVLQYVRENVESPMETVVRLMIVFAGLPEPVPNPEILDADGIFVARGDLVYFEWKILVEYDGWQHERDARQRQHDHLRRERLEAAGWRVIVITALDLKSPEGVAGRVHAALSQRGYAPRFGV